MKIFISCPQGRTFNSFFDKRNKAYLESLGKVVYNPYGMRLAGSEAAKLLAGCDVYIGAWGSPKLDGELLNFADSLKVIVHLGGNAEMLIGEEAWKRGIKVLSGGDFYAASAAEGTLAYIMAMLRRIPEFSMRLKYNNDWRHSWDVNASLIGKTVGMVNYGPIAKQLARLLAPFDVNILIYDRLGVPWQEREEYGLEQVMINRLFEESDIITVHTPRHMGYYHMIDSEQIILMKQGAFLVDTSIGGLININSLFVSLLNGKIAAVIDVFENEPLSFDKSLLYLENLMLMPHMAGATPDIRVFVARKLLEECEAYLKYGKQPLHEVKTYKAYRDGL